MRHGGGLITRRVKSHFTSVVVAASSFVVAPVVDVMVSSRVVAMLEVRHKCQKHTALDVFGEPFLYPRYLFERQECGIVEDSGNTSHNNSIPNDCTELRLHITTAELDPAVSTRMPVVVFEKL